MLMEATMSFAKLCRLWFAAAIVCSCSGAILAFADTPQAPQAQSPKINPNEEVHPPGGVFEETSPGDCLTKEIVNKTAKKEGEQLLWVTNSSDVIFLRTLAGFAAAKESMNPLAEMLGDNSSVPSILPYADSIAILSEKGKTPIALLFTQDVTCRIVHLKDETFKRITEMVRKEAKE
jgi:hypothetical protein